MSSSLDRGKLLLGLSFFLLRFLPVWTLSVPSLTLSSRLNVGDALVSASGHFELGIFPFPAGKYQLCVRYGAPIEPAVVWLANRVMPLTDKSYLELSNPSGNLQLFDPNNNDNRIPWSSNTSNVGVGKVQLLDTGNLVLANNNGEYIWESFKNGSIADTLLPGQYLYRKDNINLTSWLTTDDPAMGPYTFGWGTRANMTILQLAWTSPKKFMNWTGGAYIPAPDEPSPRTYANVDFVYLHAREGKLYIPNSPADHVILSGGTDPVSATTLKRITLDTDGGLRIWEWKVGQASKKWIPVGNWVVTERRTQCTTMGTCGPFGMCKSPKDSLNRVQCECPYGFEPLYETNVARGCEPTVPISDSDLCNATKVQFLELDGVDMPWGGGFRNLTGPDSANCKEECMKDCNCTGAVYSKDEQKCRTGTAPLYNLGYPTEDLHGTDRTAYIKISINQPPADSGPGRKNTKLILGAALGGAGALFLIGVGICICANKCKKSGHQNGGHQNQGFPNFPGSPPPPPPPPPPQRW